MHVAVLVSSVLPPSPSLPGLAQLLPAPSQAWAAVPGSSLARGRARVPSLSEAAQTPAKRSGGRKKSCFLQLVAEKFPSCRIAEEQRGQLGRWHRCREEGGWDQTDPTELDRAGVPALASRPRRGGVLVGDPQLGLSPPGMCGPHQDVAPTAAPLLRDPFVLGDFHNAMAEAAARCWGFWRRANLGLPPSP